MRTLKDMMRAVEYFVHYVFLEKPFGLDFSMRDLTEINDSRQHGYAMTSDKAITHIATYLDFKGKAFFDIGSGKGRVSYCAMKLGARIAEGVEVSKKLHTIACRNYEILKVTSVCKSNCFDATKFDRYNEFDIFFLFNPFEASIYEQVINRFMSQCSENRERYIICYGGANLQSVRRFSNVKVLHEGICPHRGNSFSIHSFSK